MVTDESVEFLTILLTPGWTECQCIGKNKFEYHRTTDNGKANLFENKRPSHSHS